MNFELEMYRTRLALQQVQGQLLGYLARETAEKVSELEAEEAKAAMEARAAELKEERGG
jgi:hypothetical protein